MSYFREQLEKWLGQIEVEANSVLDVGGGENPVKTRVKSWKVDNYRILDNDIQFKPDVDFDMNISLPWRRYFQPADVVFCLEVAEYIYDPVQFHENIYGLLNTSGVAYISYPTIYPLHNPPKIDYLRYTKNAIEKYLKLSGFRRWKITPRVATLGAEALTSFWRAEGMHPMRGTDEVLNIGYMVKAYK